MSRKQIQGDNVHVFKYIDGSPFEIVCATSMEWEVLIEEIGATTPDSGVAKEFRQRLEEYFLRLGGASTSENEANVSIFYLLNNKREVHDLSIVFTDNSGGEITIRGDFIMQSCVLVANATESSVYDIVFRGTGAMIESELEDPVTGGTNITSRSFTISSGVAQHADLIGVTIVEVCREGTEQLSMNLPYSYNSGTGTITPDPDTTIDGQKIFVIWRY